GMLHAVVCSAAWYWAWGFWSMLQGARLTLGHLRRSNYLTPYDFLPEILKFFLIFFVLLRICLKRCVYIDRKSIANFRKETKPKLKPKGILK
ncbi:MAG: hypothetical protein J6S90_03860, partial [Lentisphaeria bacterium]|nr:hypothetical protein [Lentisphaeria bacterium]